MADVLLGNMTEGIASKGMPPDEYLFGRHRAYPYWGMEPLNQTLDPGWEPMAELYQEIGINPDGTPSLYFHPWTGYGPKSFTPITNPDHPQFRKKDGSRGNPKHLVPKG